MNFTERLNQAFYRANISKTALWKHCGVSSGLVTQWLDGRVKKLGGKNLLKAAEILNVSPEWLLTGRDPAGRSHHGIQKVVEMPERLPPHIEELVAVAKTMSKDGQLVLLGRAQELAVRYPAAKANPAKS